jgi:glycerol-3-phosphate acyltransferase PlsX
MGSQLPIAVDAMGGDEAPAVMVEGAKIAASQFGVPVLLVGRPEELSEAEGVDGITIWPASEVIGMGDEPAASVRTKKDSSIVRGAQAVKAGEACALLSAGNTGAAMAASLLRIGRIRGVSRPAIAVPLPVLGSTPSTLMDCGANAEAQPEWLVQFAQMGTVYARTRFELEKPRVGVLTIGEEAGKGNSLVKDTIELMTSTMWASECGAEFVGNIEGGDVMSGAADVVVCDGFTGNVVLKSLEGTTAIAFQAIRDALAASQFSAALEVIDPVISQLEPQHTGSAMLLGVKGVSMISHGSSSAYAIGNAIRTAADMANSEIVPELRALMA